MAIARVVFLGLVALCEMRVAVAADVSPEIVVSDVTVVSSERSAPLNHAYVRVRDGRIAEVSAKPLKGGTEVDGRGKFLIPGLIDSHTHLGAVPGMGPRHYANHPDLVKLEQAQEPRSYLYFGFTTVLSLGDVPGNIKRWNSLADRPDAHFCGGTAIFQGYAFDSIAETPYFLFLPEQESKLPATVNRAEHTPDAVVQRMAADGAICVKSYYEKGFGANRNLPVPTLAMIQNVVGAAHEKHIPVFLHANAKAPQEFAVEAGVDVIAHGMWNGHELQNGAPSPEVQALLQKAIQRRMGYQPTAQVIRGLADVFDSNYLSDPLLTHAYPAKLLAWYRTDEAGFFRKELDAPAKVFEGVYSNGEAVLRYMAANHARLLFGTDTPSDATYANPPGLNGFFEMRRWVAAGVTLKQLFDAATIENAREMSLENQIGTIEAGKVAHLLLLRANPLDTVDAYNTIETVFLAGRPIKRDALSARNAQSK
jgi:imidazolonepropionase-like amidohydrolase